MAAVVAGVVLDLGISVVLAGLGIRTYETAASVHRTAVTQYELCLSSNMSRKSQLSLWDYLVKLSIPQDAAEAQELDGIKAKINRTFRQVDCQPLAKAAGK